MTALKIGICGAAGRMGGAIAALALKDPALRIGALIEAAGSPSLGQDRHGVRVGDDLSAVAGSLQAVVDFTTPEASLAHAAAAAKAGTALVVGTTGFDEEGLRSLSTFAEKIPVVLSPNMSLSVNILFDLVERAAALLPALDAEIVEAHHRYKKDAPSGTACRLAESIQRGRGKGRLVHGRPGPGSERKTDDIGIHSVRGGDAVGDHAVIFLGDGERIELIHRATSREAFAAGALAAAKWAAGKPAGLYDMRDVLGLKKS